MTDEILPPLAMRKFLCSDGRRKQNRDVQKIAGAVGRTENDQS